MVIGPDTTELKRLFCENKLEQAINAGRHLVDAKEMYGDESALELRPGDRGYCPSIAKYHQAIRKYYNSLLDPKIRRSFSTESTIDELDVYFESLGRARFYVEYLRNDIAKQWRAIYNAPDHFDVIRAKRILGQSERYLMEIDEGEKLRCYIDKFCSGWWCLKKGRVDHAVAEYNDCIKLESVDVDEMSGLREAILLACPQAILGEPGNTENLASLSDDTMDSASSSDSEIDPEEAFEVYPGAACHHVANALNPSCESSERRKLVEYELKFAIKAINQQLKDLQSNSNAPLRTNLMNSWVYCETIYIENLWNYGFENCSARSYQTAINCFKGVGEHTQLLAEILNQLKFEGVKLNQEISAEARKVIKRRPRSAADLATDHVRYVEYRNRNTAVKTNSPNARIKAKSVRSSRYVERSGMVRRKLRESYTNHPKNPSFFRYTTLLGSRCAGRSNFSVKAFQC